MRKIRLISALILFLAFVLTGCATGMPVADSSGESLSSADAGTVFRYSVNGDGTCAVTGTVKGRTAELIIPEQLDGYTVTEIGYAAFAGCGSIATLSIPETVTEIGDFAFSNCSGITEIGIPESVTVIGDQAFYGCDAGTITVNPDNVRYYGKDNCIVEKENGRIILGSSASRIPEDGSVTCIGRHAFGGCASLKRIDIPDNIRTIEEYAFVNCRSLGEAVLPKGLKTVNSYVFTGCTSLVRVEIPASVTEINKYAFSDCPIETIVFGGTGAGWKSVYKYDRWDTNVPEHKVLCTDGEISE